MVGACQHHHLVVLAQTHHPHAGAVAALQRDLVGVQTDDDSLLTAQQYIIHIVHDLGSGHGVRAIRLAEGDEVVGVCICREGGTVLTVTENGKGRRSDIDTYRITARGGKGIRNYDAAKDKVAAVKIVDDVDDVLLSSQEGIIIRLHANEIPLQSRYGSGVRVMRLGENDKVMVLARTDHDDEAQTEQIDTSDADAEPTAEQLAAMEAADAAAAAEAPEADDKGEE